MKSSSSPRPISGDFRRQARLRSSCGSNTKRAIASRSWIASSWPRFSRSTPATSTPSRLSARTSALTNSLRRRTSTMKWPACSSSPVPGRRSLPIRPLAWVAIRRASRWCGASTAFCACSISIVSESASGALASGHSSTPAGSLLAAGQMDHVARVGDAARRLDLAEHPVDGIEHRRRRAERDVEIDRHELLPGDTDALGRTLRASP